MATASPASLTVRTIATAVNVSRRTFVDADPVLRTTAPEVACQIVRVAATTANVSRQTFVHVDPDIHGIVTATDVSRLVLVHRSADTDIVSIPIPVDASPYRHPLSHRIPATVDTIAVRTAPALDITDAPANQDS